jgi:regulator of protease activity HflC (stomatin/prohibitin superfamily)
LVNLQDAVIAAQDKQIGALTDENKALRGALAASEEARKQAGIKADIQAQASKAALEGMKKAKWLDRLAWGGAGLATGYVTGRVQR